MLGNAAKARASSGLGDVLVVLGMSYGPEIAAGVVELVAVNVIGKQTIAWLKVKDKPVKVNRDRLAVDAGVAVNVACLVDEPRPGCFDLFCDFPIYNGVARALVAIDFYLVGFAHGDTIARPLESVMIFA